MDVSLYGFNGWGLKQGATHLYRDPPTPFPLSFGAGYIWHLLLSFCARPALIYSPEM